ncbi:Furin [Eumeta japonica]|uniref:Furin n=1 Tax=Eumeta variegata TaxID=151549 RepID=A0A4C1UKV7_EUMVA|nr:Furin [Eumeta japonica]
MDSHDSAGWRAAARDAGTSSPRINDHTTIFTTVLRRNLTYTERQASEADDMEPRVCSPCHYSCATCDGPESHQCLSCPKDAVPVNSADDATKLYCYPSPIASQIKKSDWLYRMNVVITSFILILIIIFAFICCIRKFSSVTNKSDKPNVAYNKLAMDDNQQRAIEVEQEIHDAILGLSDSDNESESNVKS